METWDNLLMLYGIARFTVFYATKHFEAHSFINNHDKNFNGRRGTTLETGRFD